MVDEYNLARDDEEYLDEEPTRALMVQPTPPPLVPTPLRAWVSNLPALIGERLPALWDGGQGPLARVALAGGLLALGSVVGRLATASPGALVPTRTPPPAPPAGDVPASRREIWIETEVGEATQRGRGGATVRWQRQRVRVIEGS